MVRKNKSVFVSSGVLVMKNKIASIFFIICVIVRGKILINTFNEKQLYLLVAIMRRKLCVLIGCIYIGISFFPDILL